MNPRGKRTPAHIGKLIGGVKKSRKRRAAFGVGVRTLSTLIRGLPCGYDGAEYYLKYVHPC